ncbi:MAG: TetR/AcrR family transcriptional regulator [Alphaproteobacteria bacterium]
MNAEKQRGRPRSLDARTRVLAAARALLDEGGVAAVTMEELAARTGVGKPTIYRTWPNAQAVAMAAIIETPVIARAAPHGGTAVQEMKQCLRNLVKAFATRTGRSAAALIAAADPGTELSKAFRHHVILRSRGQIQDLVLRAINDGAISGGADPAITADLVVAPVFFRLLLGHEALDEAFADAIVDQVLHGVHPQ